MPITVDTTKALTTLATLKIYLGIAVSDTTSDELLSLLINSVSSIAESYCDRSFNKQTGLTEQYDGSGNSWLYPKTLPIISVTSIHDDTDRNFTSSYLIDSADYVVYEHGVRLDGSTFNKGIKNVKIVYTAGYVLPNIASPNLPKDLEMAVLYYCAFLFKNKNKQGIASEKVGDVSFSYTNDYDTNPSAIPFETKSIFNKYRRFVL